MKKFSLIAVIAIGLCTLVYSCDKIQEAPIRGNTIILEYQTPLPEYLTEAERDLVRQQREEYNNL